MKKFYKMNINFGRMGELTSLFIAPDHAVNNLIGEELSFGEALGKHSDVRFICKKEHIQEIELDQETIEILESSNIFPTGRFPFDYCEIYRCSYCGDFKGFDIKKEFCRDCKEIGKWQYIKLDGS